MAGGDEDGDEEKDKEDEAGGPMSHEFRTEYKSYPAFFFLTRPYLKHHTLTPMTMQ